MNNFDNEFKGSDWQYRQGTRFTMMLKRELLCTYSTLEAAREYNEHVVGGDGEFPSLEFLKSKFLILDQDLLM